MSKLDELLEVVAFLAGKPMKLVQQLADEPETSSASGTAESRDIGKPTTDGAAGNAEQ